MKNIFKAQNLNTDQTELLEISRFFEVQYNKIFDKYNSVFIENQISQLLNYKKKV